MSDILDRLRGYADSRLYALPGQYVCDVPEILNEHAELVTRLLTAERERDEARRERDAMRIDHADALDAYRQMYESERDRAERAEREREEVIAACRGTQIDAAGLRELKKLRHRAERAERVVEAVRVFFERTATIHGETVGKQTILELARLYDALNAFDAAEAP